MCIYFSILDVRLIISRKLFQILILVLCLIFAYFLTSGKQVFQIVQKSISVNLNYSLQGFLPYSLKGIIKSNTWFIIEKNRSLWVFNKSQNKWIKTKDRLSKKQLKDLQELVRRVKKKTPPASILNKRPMKLKRYPVYFLPWYYR